MAKFEQKNSNNNWELSWIITICWNIWVVDKYFINWSDLNWAQDWDNVELELVSTNPNIPQCKVKNVIKPESLSDLIWGTLNKTENILTWIYKELDEKWGFIKVFWQDNDVYISKNNLHWAKDWDKVSLSILNLWKKNEAIVREILEKSKSFYFAEFKDNKFLLNWDKEIKIENKKDFKLNDWDLVSLELLEWKTGRIISKLHEKWKNSTDELKIVLKSWVNIEFSKEVLDEVDAMNEVIEESEIARRVDLRNLHTITIDWPDTKDIDDAISVEVLPNWEFKLYVHIADVTHYVKEWSFTDREAKDRATSIYFLDKVIPMIPEKLSNWLCSLNPNEDKLSLTCEILVSKNGKINPRHSKVYESVINSNARTTYKEIQDIFNINKVVWDKLQFSDKVDENLVKLVKDSYTLSRLLNNLRKKEWELTFENKEIKTELDEKRNPIKFKKYEMYESNELIKALMVTANEAVSLIYGSWPFLHRTHGKPKDEKLELLSKTLSYLEIDTWGLDLNAGNIDKLLEKVKWHEKEKALSALIMRTLQLAKYTHTLEWHHWLALKNYSHFTSPIRRYPDLQIHRIIKETIKWDIDKMHYNSILEEIAQNCSLREQRAENIERKINTLCHIKYLEKKIGQHFDWTIMMINERWTQVELDLAWINWNLLIDKEKNYSYNKIDKWLFEIVTPQDEIIKIWNKAKFRLLSVDKDKLAINFEII